MGLQVFRVRTAAFAEERRAPGAVLESQRLRQNVQDRSDSRSEIRASRGKPVRSYLGLILMLVVLGTVTAAEYIHSGIVNSFLGVIGGCAVGWLASGLDFYREKQRNRG